MICRITNIHGIRYRGFNLPEKKKTVFVSGQYFADDDEHNEISISAGKKLCLFYIKNYFK
jgi:hypothetical protein